MKTTRRLLSVILAAVITLGMVTVPNLTVKASSPAEPEILLADDTWRSGNIVTEGASDYYRVTISGDGWLTFTYQGLSIEDSHYEILDADCVKRYYSDSVFDSADSNPKTKTETLALEKGSYMIKVEGDRKDDLGTYRVKASFKAANNDEAVVNDDFETAQNLSWNQIVTGFISLDDRMDFFRVDLPSSTILRLDFNTYMDGIHVAIYDKNRKEIFRENIFFGKEGSPRTYQYEEMLNAGTYYVQITPTSKTACGRYTVSLVEKIQTQSISIQADKSNGNVYVGQKVKLMATVSPSDATDKTVKWTSADAGIASVDETTGEVIANRAGKVYITATALDGSNVSKTYKLIVVPEKPKLSNVSSTGSKKLYLGYDSQSGVTGYQIQYATNSKFKSAKTKRTTNTSFTLTNLSRNKKYYVRVRAYVRDGKKYYYGKWSNKKACRVK